MHNNLATAWPLLFTYRGPIIGRGFFASARLCGRLLASPDSEGVWLGGVNRGGFAVDSKTLDEANHELRETRTRVLVAYASEAESLEAFRSAVERYYHETDDATLAEWDVAIAAVRQGTLPVPSALPRKPDDRECFVHVEPKRIEDLTPRDNQVCHNDVDTVLPKAG